MEDQNLDRVQARSISFESGGGGQPHPKNLDKQPPPKKNQTNKLKTKEKSGGWGGWGVG